MSAGFQRHTLCVAPFVKKSVLLSEIFCVPFSACARLPLSSLKKRQLQRKVERGRKAFADQRGSKDVNIDSIDCVEFIVSRLLPSL